MRLAREVDAWRGRRRLGVLRVLSGVPGVGKSAALAWCCMWDRPGEARERGGPVAPRLGARALHRWSESAVLWERWQRVPLLCLDDLGVGTCVPAVVQGLLLTRWDAGLVTLASTNAMARVERALLPRGQRGRPPAGPAQSPRRARQGALGAAAFVTAEGAELSGAGAKMLHSGR